MSNREGVLHEAFLRRAQQSADAVAVLHGTRSITYRELARRAGGLAQTLRTLGVGLEDRVGLWLSDPMEFIVAMVGVLRAGAAYVPVDPQQPEDRARYILSDCGGRVVVSDAARKDQVTAWGLVPVLAGEANTRSAVGFPLVLPDNIAYAIYTSGSTGRPKGVEVSHRGIVNTLRWSCEEFAVDSRARCANLLGWGFDASVQALWEPLFAGGTLCLFDEDLKLTPSRLAAWLASEGVTNAYVTPALLRPMIEQNRRALEHVTTFVCGGDSMNWPGFRHAPFRLFNAYGPTECSVTSVCGRVDPSRLSDDERVPIGIPIPGIRAVIVNDDFEIGEPERPGELFLGGVGVARGYHRQPRPTAERFMPDPFSTEPGARGYRTGDIVRRRSDGSLAFLGRSDHQVKIRGHRVELGEVEAALERHVEIREAAAALFRDESGDRLVVYVVGADSELDPRRIRQELTAYLPQYMLPHSVVNLPRLPRLPSGKLDRSALPPPDPTTVESAEPATYRTPTERKLCELYQRVLRVPSASPDDDFLGLGGDSIRIMTLISEAEQEGLLLDFRRVFELPIRELAKITPEQTGGDPAASGDADLLERLDEEQLAALFDDE